MSKLNRVFLFLGVAVVAVAAAVVIITEFGPAFRYERTGYYTDKLLSVMTQIREGIPEERSDDKTANYEIDGLNFAGVIEMPDYDLSLPVYAGWDTEKLRKFPCLFSGNADNGDIIIGSTSDRELFSFVKQISVSDWITFTDMTGNRFTYEITDINHSKSADRDSLAKRDGDMVLFIKNRFAFDYVIIVADIIGE